MKEARIKIRINKSASEVFEFAINPKNTPKWIDFIQKEETDEWPIQLGTGYRNQHINGRWSEYKVVELENDHIITLSGVNSPYNVRYTVKQLENNTSELEYFEWVSEGELEEPFEQKYLQKFKKVIESE